MSDVLHTVVHNVHNLPTEQAASAQHFFSRGHDPYTHACKARPPSTDVGLLRVSLSFPWKVGETPNWLLNFLEHDTKTLV